jgi:type IV pilus assembly protein PilM
LSKSLVDSIADLFQPELPTWGCEFTARHFVVAGVDGRRGRVIGKAAMDHSGVVGSLAEKNLVDPAASLNIVRSGLSQAGFKGSEIGVVIPDDAARIALLAAENLPAAQAERETFIRWKLKKSMPFDIDQAQVAFKVLGPHAGADARSTDVLVALSPRNVVDEYVDVMDKAGVHAGFVIPSTLAVLNLVRPPAEDTLFVKVAPGCITTTIFRNQRFQFHRRVADMPIHDAVYPTILYYQDKLLGTGLERVLACVYGTDSRSLITELQDKINIFVHQLEPKTVDDMYKPVLGAVGLNNYVRI